MEREKRGKERKRKPLSICITNTKHSAFLEVEEIAVRCGSTSLSAKDINVISITEVQLNLILKCLST